VHDPLLGATLGRWQIAAVLGEGGMGRVYLATQPSIGSRVAIKVLSPECSRDRALVDRFFAEARAVNLIRHESIVGVLDLQWLEDGRPYIVMEYIAGATLAALIRGGPLPLGSVARLMGEVLGALGAAHERGIVHRDLKPDNVLVTGEGHAKVLDFGIAKLAPALRGDSPRTSTGSLLGTPHYMAPEQIAGHGNVDGRADLYAAGVTLFECVTGRRPFPEDNLFTLLRAHVEQVPVGVRALRPDVPAAYEAVIARAMAKRPEERFATAGEMAHALAGACAGLGGMAWAPLVARGPDGAAVPTPHAQVVQQLPPTVEAPTKGKKSWVPFAVVGGVVVVAAIGVGVAASGSNSGEPRTGSSTSPSPSPSTSTSTSTPRTGSTAPTPTPTPTTTTAGLGFDPKRFDAMGFLGEAERRAKGVIPDAELITFDVDGVYPDGHADLTLDDDYDATYDFRAPSKSERPAGLPVGVEADIPCMVHVTVSVDDGIEVYAGTDDKCDQPLRPRPRCTLAQVWEKAIKIGAPKNAVMQIDYLWDGWFAQIGDDTFTESLPDDC
jgi:serine/threonine protein kinase